MNVEAAKGALADGSLSFRLTDACMHKSTPTRSLLRECRRTFAVQPRLIRFAPRLNYRRPKGSVTQSTWGTSDIINLGAVELDGVSRFPGVMTSPKVRG